MVAGFNLLEILAIPLHAVHALLCAIDLWRRPWL